MLRSAFLAAALSAAFPAHANPELAALRAELQAMKDAYEARIQALESKIQRADTLAADTRAVPAPAAEPAAGNRFNPALSLILQGRYAHMGDAGERHITGYLPAGDHDDSGRGFSLDHTELVMSANIDPYFRGYFNLALKDEKASLEEAWFQTTSLGRGVSIKGGRFLSALGYQNEKHPHAWDFADNNLMYQALFGEAYGNDGLQLKWVAPTDLFMEFGVEAGRGANFPGTDRKKNGAGSQVVFGHLGGDVGASHSWRAGVSYLQTRAKERKGDIEDLNDEEVSTKFSGQSRAWIADVVWKWAPDGNARERNLTLAAEYFRRKESGLLACENGLCGSSSTGDYAATQSGFYAQGVYQFMPRWRTGYRYDQLNAGTVDFGANSSNLPVSTYTPKRHSLMVDYSPSEFSRIRLQYSKDRSMSGSDENQWFVQYVHSLGSHGAHAF